jgi:hypothetical protein
MSLRSASMIAVNFSCNCARRAGRVRSRTAGSHARRGNAPLGKPSEMRVSLEAEMFPPMSAVPSANLHKWIRRAAQRPAAGGSVARAEG